jgi:hypothetical protein
MHTHIPEMAIFYPQQPLLPNLMYITKQASQRCTLPRTANHQIEELIIPFGRKLDTQLAIVGHHLDRRRVMVDTFVDSC